MLSPVPHGSSRALSILVVDDEPDMEAMVRQMFRSRVRRGEYLLSFAGDGVEALAHVDSGAVVDVVVTDINMPRMTGLEFLAALRGRDCQAKAIVVSAYGDIGNIRAAMNLGAFDFVTKPVDFADLEATVQRTQRYLTTSRAASTSLGVSLGARLARAVQEAIVPERVLWDGCHAVGGWFVAGTTFSGDFVDAVRLEDSRVALLAARPPGRGIACAVAMMTARSAFKGAAIGERASGAVLARVNEMLGAGACGGFGVEALYAVYDPHERVVECVRSGAVGVLAVSREGLPRILAVPDTASGSMSAASVHAIAPGEALVVCSRSIALPDAGFVALCAPSRVSASLFAEAFAPAGVDFACVTLGPPA